MFTNTTSKPNDPLRYRFILVFIIIVILIAIISGKSEVFKVHPQQIKVKALVIYLAVIIIGFGLLMKWQARRIVEIQSDKSLTAAEQQRAILKLDNVWSVSHVLFYVGLGIVMPNNWTIILVFQVVWELFEDFLGYRMGLTQYIETDGKKISDIICNNAGYFLGNVIANSFSRFKKDQ